MQEQEYSISPFALMYHVTVILRMGGFNSLHAVTTYARMLTYAELNHTCVRMSSCVVAQCLFKRGWAVEDLCEAKTNR